MHLLTLLAPAVILLVALIAIGLVSVRLYRKTTAETALVRTGVGGIKVVTGGGVMVIPGLHDLVRINMKTVAISVDGGDGLITQDSRRVDAVTQFFIRVKNEREMIQAAAQSLGENTNNIDEIQKLINGKVQGVLRSITAGMDLIDLHRKRAEFEQAVKEALNKDLQPNGLELESVALVRLDETPINRLDENNAFDITGLRVRAGALAEQRRERVATEEMTALEIARTQKENRVARLGVEREEKEAAEKQRLEIAQLVADADSKAAAIAEDTTLAQEKARIARERAVREEEIASDKKLREAEIETEKQIEISIQNKAAEIALGSEKQSMSEAKASEARAKSVSAEEAVHTARVLAAAEREKSVAVIEAERGAEQSATKLRVQARVEREAAEDQAASQIALANAEAETARIIAGAIREKGEAEADAISARIEAENKVSPEVMAHKERLAKIEALPKIIAAMVEPAKHIESFRVNQISGIGGATAGGMGGEAGKTGVMGEMFRGIRENAVALPVLKALGAELGLQLEDGPEAAIATLIDPPLQAAKKGKPDTGVDQLV
ncbi:flotillin family protein [Paracoccus litorisediminis]|uniref:flotillin family protein n=1 Tax=Paracoccus litorisediminis TaxID=2006130 RepID=UPI0037313DA8